MKSGAPYWPEHADQPFGDVLNSIKKYVVSDTLTSAERENSEILSGDVASKVAELKAQESGDIVMVGSATTVRWLLRRAWSTSCTFSFTRSWSARAWPACSRPTSRRRRSSCSARRRSRLAS